MADITITIPVSTVSYMAWLRTTHIGIGMVDSEGNTLLSTMEVGPDQKDAFLNIMQQATVEVSKSFVSRQGDVNGTPFEYDGVNAIYRVNECEPVLNQASVLKSQLAEDVKNAIFSLVTTTWFQLKGNEGFAVLFYAAYSELQTSINGLLYRLHD